MAALQLSLCYMVEWHLVRELAITIKVTLCNILAEDQFKQRPLDATAFSAKVTLVSKPGAQLNNSKMFFESMIISSLEEVKYNEISIQRF